MNIGNIVAAACGIAIFLISGCSRSGSLPHVDKTSCTLLIGSYSEHGDSALKSFTYDCSSGAIKHEASFPVSNASYFIQSPSGMVYAVSEGDDGSSSVTALRPTDKGGFELINSQPVGSSSPCYIEVSPDGRYVITANYSGGSAAIFPLGTDGEILPRKELISFSGHGPVEGRQDQPHPHCIAFTPDNRYMLVNDLGNDCIHMFPVLESGPLPVDTIPSNDVNILPASGPRHIVFNHNGKYAYLINELADNVTVLNYDGNTLTPVQYVEADTLGAMGAGDIHLSPDGRHLYASLRIKNDGIVTFDVDSASGLLSYSSHTPTLRHPRNFAISPDGKKMFVACRDDNAVQILNIDSITGIPSDTGLRIDVPKAVCVKFVKTGTEQSAS